MRLWIGYLVDSVTIVECSRDRSMPQFKCHRKHTLPFVTVISRIPPLRRESDLLDYAILYISIEQAENVADIRRPPAAGAVYIMPGETSNVGSVPDVFGCPCFSDLPVFTVKKWCCRLEV